MAETGAAFEGATFEGGVWPDRTAREVTVDGGPLSGVRAIMTIRSEDVMRSGIGRPGAPRAIPT